LFVVGSRHPETGDVLPTTLLKGSTVIVAKWIKARNLSAKAKTFLLAEQLTKGKTL